MNLELCIHVQKEDNSGAYQLLINDITFTSINYLISQMIVENI